MIFGYCRISTKGQSFDLQEDALKNAGCERVFRDLSLLLLPTFFSKAV